MSVLTILPPGTAFGLPEDCELMLGFCPTGPGGGVDPSCGSGAGGGGSSAHPASMEEYHALIKSEEHVIASLHAEKQDVFKQIAEAKKAGDQTKVNALYQKSSKLNKQIKKQQESKGAIVKPPEKNPHQDKVDKIKSLLDQKKETLAQIKDAKAAGDQTKVNALYTKSSKLGKEAQKLQEEIGKAPASDFAKPGAKIAPPSIAKPPVTAPAAFKGPAQLKKEAEAAPARTVTVVTDKSAIDVVYNGRGAVHESCCVDNSVKPDTANIKVLENHYKKFVGTSSGGGALTDAERASVNDYTGAGYTHINGALRKASGDLSSLHNNTALSIKHIDSAIEKAPRVPKDMVVARGMNPKILEKLKTGDEFVDHGFMSTTTGNAHTAFGSVNPQIGERAFLNIKVPAGAKALYVGNHLGILGERELILPRGSRLKIEGVKLVPQPSGVKIRVIQAHLIQDTA